MANYPNDWDFELYVTYDCAGFEAPTNMPKFYLDGTSILSASQLPYVEGVTWYLDSEYSVLAAGADITNYIYNDEDMPNDVTVGGITLYGYKTISSRAASAPPLLFKVGKHGDNYFNNAASNHLTHNAGTLYVSEDTLNQGYIYYDNGENFINIIPKMLDQMHGGTNADLSAIPANAVLIQKSDKSVGHIATASGALYATSANGAAKFGTLPVKQGGTGITSNPSMLVNLASTSADTVFKASPRPGVTGILGAGNGGTGYNNLKDAMSALANALDTQTSNPQDADFFIAQSAGGGTTTTTYYRKPLSALYNYVQGKLDLNYVNVTGDSMTGDLTMVAASDVDRFINFVYTPESSGKGYDWRIGYLGSGSGDENYFAIQSNGTDGSAWTSAVRYGLTSLDAGFSGNIYPLVTNTKTLGTSSLKWKNVYATTFNGALSGNASTATKLKTARKIEVNLGTNTIATFDGSADIVTGVTGTLRVVDGGTGIGVNPSMLINLESESADTVFKTSPRPGVTGTLSAAHGGTGCTTLQDAMNALINALDTGSSNPQDGDYFISQYVGGNSADPKKTTYYRRPMSALYNYLQGKLDLAYVNITGDTMTGDLSFGGENKDQFINFLHSANDASSDWRIGHLGSGSGNTNYFVIESGQSGTWVRAVQIGMTDYNLTIAGSIIPTADNSKTLGTSSYKWKNVYATTFNGALSGNADTATKLKTPRKIGVNLGTNTIATFDGSADIETGVTGTLRVVDGGTGAGTFTSGGVLYGQGTAAIKATSKGGTADILVGGNGTPKFVTPAVSWVAGTTAGPTFRLAINSTNYDAVIPSASGTASGVVTTNAQTFKGVKTFSDGIVCNGTATFNQKFTISGNIDAYYNSSSDYKDGSLYVGGGITASMNMRVDGGTIQFAKQGKIQYDSTKECFNFVF